MPGIRRIYVQDYGVFLGAAGEQFVLRRGKEVLAKVPASEVSLIQIMTDRTSMSVAAAHLAARHMVWIVLSDRTGRPYAFLEPITRRAGIRVRRAQYSLIETDIGRELGKRLILGKLINQRNILRRLLRRYRGKEEEGVLSDLYARAVEEVETLRFAKAPRREFVMSQEARVARLYWEAWSVVLPDFPGRRKRYENPEDCVNMALNLAYTLLEADCYVAVFSTNLDPYLGLVHVESPRRAALVMDFMEQFRQPVVDMAILAMAQEGRIASEAGKLSQRSVRDVIAAYAARLRERLTLRGRRARVEAHILGQARRLEEAVAKATPEYVPFTVR